MKQKWFNEWHRLGAVDDVVPGAVIQRRVEHMELALFNIDGESFAGIDACDGCGQPLSEGKIKQIEVEFGGCGIRMSIAEEIDSNPGSLFPVLVVNDEIFAWIEKTFQK